MKVRTLALVICLIFAVLCSAQTVTQVLHHDKLDGFVANKHINHSAVSIIAGTGLSGGGTIAADRTFNVNIGTDVQAEITAGTTSQFWRGDKSWQTFLGETSTTAYRGDRGKIAYDHIHNLTTDIDHDLILNFVAAKHLDWTAATDALYTTNSGRFDGGIGIGADPLARFLYIFKTGAHGFAAGVHIDNYGAGDAVVKFELNEVAKFILGVDNSVAGDPFKISVGGVLGTNDALTIDSSGNFVIPGTITGGAYNGVTLGFDHLVIDDVVNNNSLAVFGDWTIDQSVASGATPTFGATNFSDGGSNAIITTTQETNFETAYTHSQDNSQAHTDYLLNNANDSTSGTLGVGGALPGGHFGDEQLSAIGSGQTRVEAITTGSGTQGPGFQIYYDTDTFVGGFIYYQPSNITSFYGPNPSAAMTMDSSRNVNVLAGTFTVVAGESLFGNKIKFTQVDGNEYIDSTVNGADSYMLYGATTAHRFNTAVIVGGTTPDSLFEVDGAEGLAIETVTGNTTLDSTHSTLLVNASGNVTVTLPTAASAYNNTDGIGRIHEVKKIDADADTVTVDGDGAELIDGAATAVLTVQWETISVQSNGTSWYII